MIKCEPGDTISLSVSIDDGTTTLYPQSKLYDVDGNLIDTVNLTHLADGYYQGSYTPNGNYKHLTAHYRIYTDSGHTVLSDYAAVSDKIYVAYDAKNFGGGGVVQGLTKKEIESIAKLVWESDEAKKLKELIAKKSEFDPQKDLVKTNIEIPTVNLREIKDSLNTLLSEVKNKKTISGKDYFPELKKLKDLILGIRIPDNKELKQKLDLIQQSVSSLHSPQVKFSEQEISKIAGLIGRIVKMEVSNEDTEKMLEALNLQEDKRFKELKKLLMGIMYSVQMKPEKGNSEEALLLIANQLANLKSDG